MKHFLNLHRFVLDRFAGAGDEETFAIADIHGRADLLELALDAIAAHPAEEGRTRRLVTLGDYIDRGPAGVRVLDMLMAAPARLGFPVTNLLGNHEQMLLVAMSPDLATERRIRVAELWLANGGVAVLRELAEAGHAMEPVTLEAIEAALGPERLAFLRGLARCHRPEGGDVMFVHGGLHPETPLDAFLGYDWRRGLGSKGFTEDLDPCWVRASFLEWLPSSTGAVGHHGLFVVHGHTPQDGCNRRLADHVRRDRVNLDAYAYQTNRLRVARLVGNALEVFEVVPPGPVRDRLEKGLAY